MGPVGFWEGGDGGDSGSRLGQGMGPGREGAAAGAEPGEASQVSWSQKVRCRLSEVGRAGPGRPSAWRGVQGSGVCPWGRTDKVPEYSTEAVGLVPGISERERGWASRRGRLFPGHGLPSLLDTLALWRPQYGAGGGRSHSPLDTMNSGERDTCEPPTSSFLWPHVTLSPSPSSHH